MRIFISSVVGGLEDMRTAAADAVEALDHEVVRAETFAASPDSPQVACLAGVRSADVVIVILGARYGEPQASGKSPTHEEFEEATRNKHVFVFVQTRIEPESLQAEFISEARGWGTGHFTSTFADADELRAQVTRALHRWQLASATGQIDAEEMEARALALLPTESRHRSSARTSLAIAIVGAPRQSILRPSEIEDARLGRRLQQQALFGEPSIFDTSEGTEIRVDGHNLTLSQSNARLTLREDGSLLFVLPLPEPGGLSVMIEEDVAEKLLAALIFASQVLESVDPTQRLSSVAVVVSVLNPSDGEWRTRAEHDRRPNSMQMSRFWDDTPVRAALTPVNRSRAALRQQADVMAQDFTVLLRRFWNDTRR